MTILKVYLRGREAPMLVPMASVEHAQGTIVWAVTEWLRLPPEARPAKAWLIARDSTETVVSLEGVNEEARSAPIAYIDPREVVGLQAVSVP